MFQRYRNMIQYQNDKNIYNVQVCPRTYKGLIRINKNGHESK